MISYDSLPLLEEAWQLLCAHRVPCTAMGSAAQPGVLQACRIGCIPSPPYLHSMNAQAVAVCCELRLAT